MRQQAWTKSGSHYSYEPGPLSSGSPYLRPRFAFKLCADWASVHSGAQSYERYIGVECTASHLQGLNGSELRTLCLPSETKLIPKRKRRKLCVSPTRNLLRLVAHGPKPTNSRGYGLKAPHPREAFGLVWSQTLSCVRAT